MTHNLFLCHKYLTPCFQIQLQITFLYIASCWTVSCLLTNLVDKNREKNQTYKIYIRELLQIYCCNSKIELNVRNNYFCNKNKPTWSIYSTQQIFNSYKVSEVPLKNLLKLRTRDSWLTDCYKICCIYVVICIFCHKLYDNIYYLK